MQAGEQSVALAYRMGLVTDPRQWAKVAMIDLRGNDNSGIHMNWRVFPVRDRMDSVLGNHDNQVIWRFGPGLWPSDESNLIAEKRGSIAKGDKPGSFSLSFRSQAKTMRTVAV